ncbi:MAG TPA: site-2 protease family protein [Phycisphaerales bacterium]|nr:site-2 protease family protein [Phycisphaerales bacterium]
MLKTVLDFLLVAVGFGLIIFVHELGHFLAARWAGIRVLAFAIGFGPALVSYRKGLGLRRGSSEREYMEKHRRDASISATEYRLNYLPFGGYVKMLGQDDMDATARSTEADSYQSCHPWKRLVVISAGVVMNLITAAALFVFVFMVGRQVTPSVIGGVARNSPAALAQPVAPITNVHPGLKAGDRVLRINGKSLRSFDDLTLSIAMAPKDEPLEFVVDRGGEELTFSAVPRRELTTGLLAVGLQPAFGLTLPKLDNAADAGALASFLKGEGVQGLGAGDRVSLVDGRAAVYAHDIDAAIAAGRGEAVTVTVARADGTTSTANIEPRAEFENDLVASDAKSVIPVRHILGLTGVLRVLDADPEGAGPKASEQGLKDGDVFAVLGGVEYPSIAEGIMQIREHQGKSIDAVVIRQVESADGGSRWVEVPLPGLKVSRDGRLGFARGNTGDVSALLAAPIGTVRRNFDQDVRTAAAASGLTAGTTVLEVDALPTPTLGALRDALRLATRKAMDEKQGATVTLRVRRPVAGVPDASAPIEDIRWELTKEDVAAVHSLGWTNGLAEAGVLQPAEVALKADNPLAAVKMGVAETKRVMLMTYLTFARLAQGSVKVEHLKGPVGIAHLGTLVADKGLIWLLFFLALISVNLAVINFLPLPIVDGGQALFIIYEWVRGKPVPVGFQNAVTMAGLVMIGVMFLLVTYNDIRGLFGL